MTRTALISVYDKTDIEAFARFLVERGWTILASGGTARALENVNIPVRDVASLMQASLKVLIRRWRDEFSLAIGDVALEGLLRMVGEPLLNHRVVTLSREVFAGILARYIAADKHEIEALGIPYIDLVCVDLYPLETYLEEFKDGRIDAAAVNEKIDIGGPSLLRAGAKANRIVISDPSQREEVIHWIDNGHPNDRCFRMELAAQAESVASRHANLAHMFWQLCCQLEKC